MDRGKHKSKDKEGKGSKAGSPSFLVDHLASFSASVPDRDASNTAEKSASATLATPTTLLTPDEAVYRLQQLIARRKVWATRVTLLITSRQLVVVDAATNATMEQFALGLVYRPTAVASGDRSEKSRNVAVITVLGDAKQHTPPEVHLFHCLEQPAQILVHAILTAKSNKSPTVEPLPREPDSDVWPDTVLEYEKAAQQTVAAVNAYQQSQNTNKVYQTAPHASNAGANERVVKSVEVLNRCFDDIERFMTRLQGIADAFKELEKRRKNRKKKGPQPGDGMLSMRVRNPGEKDFMDVLQKFKVSFNLLARLKSHIHDPNSPELIHFLFTPLSLIIEAARNPQNADNNVVSRVVAPLLTPQAVSLLQNCLTSKEMELWMTMGDAWTKSRDQWTAPVPPFQLRFSDGWEPECIYWTEDQPVQQQQQQTNLSASLGRPANYGELTEGRDSATGVSRRDNDQFSSQSSQTRKIYASNPPPSGNMQQRADMSSPPPGASTSNPARPWSPVDSNSDRRQGGARSPVQDASRMAVAGPAPNGVSAMGDPLRPSGGQGRRLPAPGVLPKPFRAAPAMRDYAAQDDFIRELHTSNSKIYQAIHTREGLNHSELSIVKGDILEVLDDSRNWWRVRNHRKEVGHVPYTLLQPYNGPQP